jgi:hypothetical protein
MGMGEKNSTISQAADYDYILRIRAAGRRNLGKPPKNRRPGEKSQICQVDAPRRKTHLMVMV